MFICLHMDDTLLIFATPRKLPRARNLVGRVAVLDLAFASDGVGKGFDKMTLPLICGLGERLAVWVDHHDHDEHQRYCDDSRFVLYTKAEHGACPQIITPELVQRIGRVDTIVCHTDFDGLASAAKWLRQGVEPYEGCDQDAWAIDTRMRAPSPQADTIDRALRARPHDRALFGVVVRLMYEGLRDQGLWQTVQQAAEQLRAIEAQTRRLSERYMRVDPGVALLDMSDFESRIDKTLLLLLGQQREPIAMIVDGDTINVATRFDSGVNLVQILGLSGGMPTRVSIPAKRFEHACAALRMDYEQAKLLVRDCNKAGAP